ncbi:MAG: VWA domain-containing protein [Bryobacteraceae bacterium]|jgi:VWFA-related protein
MQLDNVIRVSRRDLLRFGAALLPAGKLLAWQQTAADPQAKFSMDVNVVNVLVSVRDKQGKIVHDLNKDDFTLEEDGRPQTIKYFAQQTDMPLTLGLLIDTSGSQRRVLDQERNASRDFFHHVMREDKDQAFVIHFDREVELLQDMTSSKKDLDASLQDVETSRPQLNRRNFVPADPQYGGGYPQSGGGYPQGGGRYPQGGGQGRGGTALYDAVLLGSDELMKKQTGRKAMMLLSDGVDNGSKVTLNSAIESAQRSDTLVYSIRFADNEGYGNSGLGGLGFPGGMGRRGGMGGNRMPQNRVDGKKILEQISRETGGSYFEVTNKMPLDKIYDRIEEDLRNQYSLGYTSDQTGSGYRKIHVTAKMKNVVLQTREGYYAK